MNEMANNQKPSCSRRQKISEILIVASILLITFQNNGISGAHALDSVSDSENNTQSTICQTPACIQAAATILSSMNRSVDPCDNFYDFACGEYMKKSSNRIFAASSPFHEIYRLVTAQIKTILSQPSSENEIKPFKLAKNYYQSCMNEKIIQKRGIQPLVDLLEEFGGWPVVKGDSWSEDSFDWIEVLKKFRLSGLDTDVIFTLSIASDLKNTSVRLLNLDQLAFGLDREFLVKGFGESNVKSYHKFMVRSAITLGADIDDEKYKEELKKSIEFEMKLANISSPRVERRNFTNLYNRKTIKELQELYPYMNWLDYMKAMMLNGLNITEDEVITNFAPEFFERLGEVLNSTSKRTIANYLLWRIVLSKSKTLSDPLRYHEMQYRGDIWGLPLIYEIRWIVCTTEIITSLPISVGAMFSRKYFDSESKTEAINMVNNIRNAFVDMLNNVTWLDNDTRLNAVNKAKSIIAIVGHPNEFINNATLEEYYGNLELEPDNFFLNSMRLKKFEMDYLFNRLGKPVNRTDWTTHSDSVTVNAFYKHTTNSIQLPVAILQSPFFSVNSPRYLNYGAIGEIIGHEITHGFDDMGRQLDANGNLNEWWDPNTRAQFLEKAKCIIEQYGNYTDLKTNLNLNGINTQGENIADNGGLRAAYNAYKNWVILNGPEDTLPSLNYNQQQLFWIASAQNWCTSLPAGIHRLMIITDSHSLDEFRLNGAISNMQEFTSDFKCPNGSKMNPTQKCRVW